MSKHENKIKGNLGENIACEYLEKDGYRIIKVKGKQFKAHRIVWLLCNGKFPDAELDHINRNRLDNRIENLRESNRYQQCLNQNKKVNKDTGYVGIHEDKTTKGLLAKYTFRLNKKCYRFRTLEEAVKKRNEILEEMRSEHGNF